jgi:hypothetical protein
MVFGKSRNGTPTILADLLAPVRQRCITGDAHWRVDEIE